MNRRTRTLDHDDKPHPCDHNLTHDERLRAAGLEVRARVYSESLALQMFCGEK